MILIARHGESIANLENTMAGSIESPLTERGKHQALELAQELLKAGFDKDKKSLVISSPLSRAYETANIVSTELELTQIVFPTITEQYFGDLEGENKDDLANKIGVDQLYFYRRDINSNPPNGEYFSKVLNRAKSFQICLDKLHEIYPQILVVAHNNILRALALNYGLCSPSNFSTFEMQNAKALRLK